MSFMPLLKLAGLAIHRSIPADGFLYSYNLSTE